MMGEGMADQTQVLSLPMWRQEVYPKEGLFDPHGKQQPQFLKGTQDLGHQPSPLPPPRLRRETHQLRMNLGTSGPRAKSKNISQITYHSLTQNQKPLDIIIPLN